MNCGLLLRRAYRAHRYRQLNDPKALRRLCRQETPAWKRRKERRRIILAALIGAALAVLWAAL